MALATDSIAIDQGVDWAQAWTYSLAGVNTDGTETTPVPVDLTGWAAKAQVRKRKGAADAVATWATDPVPMTTTTTTTNLDGTTTTTTTTTTPTVKRDGLIELGADGSILLSLLGNASDAWTWYRSPAVWDLKLYDPDGRELRFLEGAATLSAAVTTDV